MREITIKLGLSIVICVLATWILFFTPLKDKTGSAQAVTTLNTTWTASGFMNAAAYTQGGSSVGPVTLGVVKWHNVTKENNEVVYEENWTADLPTSGNFVINAVSGRPQVVLPSGYDLPRFNSSWLYNGGGNNLSDTRPITFSFTDTAQGSYSQNNIGRQDFKAIGNALKCVAGGNATCLYATGSYGYNLTGDLGDGTSEAIDNFGALIPTKWTVTGTVY